MELLGEEWRERLLFRLMFVQDIVVQELTHTESGLEQVLEEMEFAEDSSELGWVGGENRLLLCFIPLLELSVLERITEE